MMMHLIIDWHHTIIILVELVMISGQTVHPVDICTTLVVSVPPGGFGIIKHVRRYDQAFYCTTTLRDLNHKGQLAVENLLVEPLLVKHDMCRPNSFPIIIDSVRYCYHGTITIKDTTNVAWFSAPANTPNFVITYYSNVGSCGSTITIPESARENQLSGIISSSYTVSRKVNRTQCDISIANLPNENVIVRFTTFPHHISSSHISIENGNRVIDHRTTSLLVTAITSTKRINIQARVHNGYFVIKFAILTCGDPPTIAGAAPPDSVWFVGTVARYACAPYFYILQWSRSSIKCELVAHGTKWSDHAGIECIHTPGCRDVPLIAGGSNNAPPAPFALGTVVRYSCDDQHYMVSEQPPSIKCEFVAGNYHWSSHSGIKCILNTGCPDIPLVAGSIIFAPPAPWGVGAEVRYSCADQFNMASGTPSSVKCDVDAYNFKWSDHFRIKCIRIICNLKHGMLSIANGYPTSEAPNGNYYYRELFIYECDEGFRKDSEVIRCRRNHTWTYMPACYAIECPVTDEMITIANGKRTSKGQNGLYYYKDLFTFLCEKGFKWKVEVIQCQENGSWSDIPACYAECPMTDEMLIMANGKLTSDGSNGRYYYKDFFTYFCDDGDKKIVVQCQKDGTWSDIPGCFAECPVTDEMLAIASDSPAFKGQNGTYYYPDLFTYLCDDGTKKREEVIECQKKGTWSGLPACHGVCSAACAAGIAIGIISLVMVVIGFIYFKNRSNTLASDHTEGRTVDQSMRSPILKKNSLTSDHPEGGGNDQSMLAAMEASKSVTHPLKRSRSRMASNVEVTQPVTHRKKRSRSRNASNVEVSQPVTHPKRSSRSHSVSKVEFSLPMTHSQKNTKSRKASKHDEY